MGAWFMNSDGATGETDRCDGGSEDLTVSAADTIPTSASVPTGYSGASRNFEFTEIDYMHVADGGTTDVTGAEQGLTICAWVDLEDTTVDGYVISKWSTGVVNERQYLLKYESSTSSMEVRISSDGTTTNDITVTGSDDVTSGFHHACGVHDPVNNLVLLYVDGYEDNTGAWTLGVGVTNSDADFRIGTAETDTRPWDGLIDEVIVLDRVLTASEVLGLFTNGIDGSKGAND